MNTCSETESLDTNAEPETSTASCSSCFEVFDLELLYRCSTCNSKNEDEEQNNQTNYCCESCITSHIRRKHEVVDKRGYSPAICDTHKKLSALYCNECESVLCHSCIMDHSGHTYQSLSQKSSKVRKNIFEYLNKIEEKSKPLKHLETLSEDSSKKVGDFRSSLRDENLVETLKSMYNGVIESNLASWIEIVDEIKMREVSEKTDGDATEKYTSDVSIDSSSHGSHSYLSNASADEKFQTLIHSEAFRDHIKEVTDGVNKSTESLKKMLSMSDGNCITHFNANETVIKASVEDCEEELGKHACLEWSAEAEDYIRNSISDALRSLKLCLIQSISVEIVKLYDKTSIRAVVTKHDSLNLSDSSASSESGNDYRYLSPVLSSSFEEENFCLRVLKDAKRRLSTTFLESLYFPSSEVSFVLKIIENGAVVALCTTSYLVLFFCLISLTVIEQRQLDDSSIPVGFCQLLNKGFALDLWNSEEKILFVEKEQIRTDFKLRPKRILRIWNRVHIVDSDNNIVIYDTIAKAKLHISHFHHGLSSIDNIVAEKNREKVLLCQCKMKLVLVCCISLSSDRKNFAVLKLIKVDLPASPTVERFGCNFDSKTLFVYTDSSVFKFKYEA